MPPASPKKGGGKGKKSPKEGTPSTKARSTSDDVPFEEGGEADGGVARLEPAPTTITQTLDGLVLEDLPSPEAWKQELGEKITAVMPILLSTFIYYTSSSDPSLMTIEAARRIRLPGFKKLIKDLGLAPKEAPTPTKGKASSRPDVDMYLFSKLGGSQSVDMVQLTLSQTLSVLVHLSFYKQNVRYSYTKDGPKQMTVPVLQCMAELLSEAVPKLKRLSGPTFSEMLAADDLAQKVVADYQSKIDDWKATLAHRMNENGSDLLSEFINAFVSTGVIGETQVTVAESNGLQYTHKSTLTKAQVTRAFFDSQGGEAVAFGPVKDDVETLVDAICRCGDKKYSAIMEMSFSERIEGILQNLFGEATAMEVMEKHTAPSVPTGADGEEDPAKAAEAAALAEKNWLTAWRNMSFKQLHMYPLWESELYDIVKDSFEQLRLIFQYYCGSTIAGSDNIEEATSIGLEEMLDFARDTGIPNDKFALRNVEQQMMQANSEAMAQAAGSVDRKKLSKQAKKNDGGMGHSSADAEIKRDELAKANQARRAQAATLSLNLFEFISTLVRIGFYRANPTHGMKGDKGELTPVPQAFQLLLTECILPKAKRDTSGAFKKVFVEDVATQKVFRDYKEKLRTWINPILRRQRKVGNLNPKMSYKLWRGLMDGPGGGGATDGETAERNRAEEGSAAARGKKADCPKMIGEWQVKQESEITGDERVGKFVQMTFHAKLSMAQVGWNFLRSQSIEQLSGGDVEGDTDDIATLDFNELQECIARCAADMYRQPIETYVPSLKRNAMTLATATQSFLKNLLSESVPEVCMWEATIIRAERFDPKNAKPRPDQRASIFKLWQSVWQQVPLMDIHHFPLWEKDVHDLLQKHFPVIQRIFAHYTKGVSGMDSAADALEMELEEFHDWVKDAKIETRLVNFTLMTNVFAKANSANTADAFEQRKKAKRGSAVAAELKGNEDKKKDAKARVGDFSKDTEDRFGVEQVWGERFKVKKPDNRLTLVEFVGLLVRISFLRANPKHGSYDNKQEVQPLPGCLATMLESFVIPNSKQDMSQVFREQLANDGAVQAMIHKYNEDLKKWYSQCIFLTQKAGMEKKGGVGLVKSSADIDQKLLFDVWLDVCKGAISFKQLKGSENWTLVKATANPNDIGLGETALVGETYVQRESDICGDDRAKEKYHCRLTLLETKMAFFNSQNMEEMKAGDGEEFDAAACLDYTEFVECLCRCAQFKFGELGGLMTLAQCCEGMFQVLLQIKTDEAVIRDYTYIHADRYDWRLSQPMPNQTLSMHRKWQEAWQCIELGDVLYFPTWEKDVHDLLQECFSDLISIFSHYSKSVGGSGTAEDAVEMTMSEFKNLVKDVGLETKDLKFDVMTNMFKKANAGAATAEAAKEKKKQRAHKNGATDSPKKGGKKSPKAGKKSKRDEETDVELVLYEFVELLIRIAFWRANPYFGLRPTAPRKKAENTKDELVIAPDVINYPECLRTMLHEVVLPNAKRDDSHLFKEMLASDKDMQAVLSTFEPKLKKWWNQVTADAKAKGEERRVYWDQWQDLLKAQKMVGNWEIAQTSDISGDERCRDKIKASLSLAQAKMAFIDSQGLDQMSAGVDKDETKLGTAASGSDMTTLDYDEMCETIARCGVGKYKSVRQMSAAQGVQGMIQNIIGELNEEEVMATNTHIVAPRFDVRRNSMPIEGQTMKDHRMWLECWKRIELHDVYYFPLWEKGVHDVLQKHFFDLQSIFLAYSRSALGSGSAADAMEMEMAEFKDFIDECMLETKEISFALMTNNFQKANAVNTGAAHEAFKNSRKAGNAREKHLTEAPATEEVAGSSVMVNGVEVAEAAVKDQELVLYEFLNVLTRIAFQRANPTHGNFNDKAQKVMLPGCLERMIEDEILPRARKDQSSDFRETVMEEPSVKAVIEKYSGDLKRWYVMINSDDARQGISGITTDKMQFDDWTRVVDKQDLIGDWTCTRTSDIVGDPRKKDTYRWKFSMPQAKNAFMDSQAADQLEVGRQADTDEMAVLDFDEFLECVARSGVDKYRAVKGMSPADAVEGMCLNILNVPLAADERAKGMSEVDYVKQATHVKCDRMDPDSIGKLEGDSDTDLEKWTGVWTRIQLHDIHLFPTWEAEVHGILQPLFKEITTIFLAYTRSLNESSAADALEMSMSEFKDFVTDTDLETKKYNFTVMTNQFVKANATEVQARTEKGKKGKIKGTETGEVAKMDQELVLYEFVGMLVRLAFWRANPDFGLYGNKDELIPIGLALNTMLNEKVLPNAKRETSAQFRATTMQDEGIIDLLKEGGEWRPRIKAWYDAKVADDSEEKTVSNKLGFEEWVRVCDRLDLVGDWEVEQLSEITGDKSCQGNIRVRLSHAMCKAAFMDSQGIDQLSGAQAAEGGTADQVTNEMTVLDFDEFLECLCRCGCSKYSSVKVMKPAAKVKGFLENFLDEKEVQQVVQESTYIRATRFDAVNESMPLDGQEPAAHQHWLGEWKQIELSGLYAFPTWEKEVHDILQKNYHDLASIFRAYAKSLKDVSPDAKATGATLMDIEEFNDFVVDVGLETKHYKLEQMAEQFDVADKAANKGIAGPKANMQLTIPEFMNVLCRVAFWRLNPEFGELTAELDLELTPVPHALTIALKEVVLPNALRDDAVSFRQDVYALPAVQEVIGTYKDRLREWFGALPDVATSGNKVTMKTWVQTMSTLGQVGTFSCVQESDVTGDERAGMIYKCRLSLPQVQAEFIESQQDFSKISQGGLTTDNTTLDFDEMLECIARCGVDKYRAIKAISTVGAIEGMCRNILGDAHEEQIMNKALYIHAPRFVPSGDGDEDWVACWNKVKVDKVPGFPLWEEAVHNELQGVWQEIKSVFRAYSAGSDGPGDTMDFAEFEDFILEADLPTKTYGFQAISGQFTQANKGSKDHVLEIDEFVSMLISIAFFRANPNYGLKGTSSAASGTANLDTDFDGVADSGTPLPGALTECLEVMLKSTRRDDAAKFVDEVMLAPDVAEILKRNEEVLFVVWEDLSEGRDFMTLEEWLAVLDERALFGECTIDHDGQILKARFTEPQAKAAFLQSVSDKSAGLSQQDFIECLSRCGVAKYRGVPFLSAPDVIAGFIQNLVGEADEEEVIRGAKPSLPDGFKSGFKEKAGARITEKVKAAEDIDEE